MDEARRAKALDRVKKLLALARCDTAAEAGLAAAKAQILIDRYRLEAALVEADDERAATRNPIESVTRQTLYTYPSTQVATWVLRLAGTVVRLNGCTLWFRSGDESQPATLSGAGQEDDLSTVSALLAYLVAEIDRVTRKELASFKKWHGRGPGRTYANSFRLGAVATIANRMQEAHERSRQEALDPSLAYQRAVAEGDTETLLELDHGASGAQAGGQALSGSALVKVETALARLDSRLDAAESWAQDNMRLRKGSRRSSLFSRQGYQQGQIAGRNIELSPRQRRLQ